ncbi:MAG: metallophosphoesterase family protein [Candidatus Omnitrophota bacterium]
MIKIGVVSDTHISDNKTVLSEKMLAAFKQVDMIIHAGDITNPSVLEKLKKICKDVKAVYGNMDSQEIREALPEKQIITAGKYKIGISHGYGPPAKLIDFLINKFHSDKVDVIIFGHSHSPVNEKRGNILFFNPGSPTDKIFAKYNSFGILEVNDKITAKIIRI